MPLLHPLPIRSLTRLPFLHISTATLSKAEKAFAQSGSTLVPVVQVVFLFLLLVAAGVACNGSVVHRDAFWYRE